MHLKYFFLLFKDGILTPELVVRARNGMLRDI
jgi:hypothetical protein